jgi:GAF domain-containing protein
MSEETRRAAAAVGAIGSEESYRALLQSIVEVARAIFRANASSVFLLDEEGDELVFEAVCGEGEGELLGMRFPAGTGVAGWVLTTRQPLVLEDASSDPRFAREAAERTGYVPKSMMAVPLLHEERAIGVLYVLDRPQEAAFTLSEMDLLGLFANQAAIALDLLLRARRARAVLAGAGSPADAAIARVAAALEDSEGRLDEHAVQLLEALAGVLRRRDGAA